MDFEQKPSHNRYVSATPPTSGVSGFIRLGRGSFGTSPTPHSATFWAPTKIKANGMDCLYFCLFRRPKRRQHPVRYAKLGGARNCIVYIK